jgi:hypothetical protein
MGDAWSASGQGMCIRSRGGTQRPLRKGREDCGIQPGVGAGITVFFVISIISDQDIRRIFHHALIFKY